MWVRLGFVVVWFGLSLVFCDFGFVFFLRVSLWVSYLLVIGLWVLVVLLLVVCCCDGIDWLDILGGLMSCLILFCTLVIYCVVLGFICAFRFGFWGLGYVCLVVV